MGRNSSGTYSLPSGNPVLTGTTISSTTHNNTMSDVAAELTSSLDRQGRGGMTGQLKTADGTIAAPAHSFTSETGSGLYRAGATDVRVAVNATDIAQFTSSTLTLPRGVTVTQAASNTAGATVTGNGSGAGVAATGGTTGAGVTGTGGSGSGVGGAFTASAGNSIGATGAGNGSGAGLSGTGGASGPGVRGTGGSGSGVGGIFTASAGNSNGVEATGNGTGGGVYATGGASNAAGLTGVGGGTTGKGVVATCATAATGATRQLAAALTNGDLDMSGVTDPDTTTAITNALTPKGIVKAWARVQTDGAGGVTVLDGLNIASSSVSAGAGGYVQLTLAAALADINGGAQATPVVSAAPTSVELLGANINSTTQVRIFGLNVTTAPAVTQIDFATAVKNFVVTVYGAQ